jgi:hypothetical protein
MARPKGIKETKPRRTTALKMAELAKSRGLSPLDMMLKTAEFAWELACDKQANGAQPEEVLMMMQVAAVQAEKAAPYLHSRLSLQRVDARLSFLDALSPDQQRTLSAALAVIPSDEESAESGGGSAYH